MKFSVYLLIIGFAISVAGCEKVSPNAAELSVEFSWEGMKQCGWGNPELRVGGVPEKTKFLKISMYDHVYSHDHGTVTTPYTGNGDFRQGLIRAVAGPMPAMGSRALRDYGQGHR